MKQIIFIISFSLVIANVTACDKSQRNSEINLEDAVSIAKQEAKSKNFDVTNSDIEVLKVKRTGYERGPIRLTAIVRYFPKEKYSLLFDKEYWIVFFYPKGQQSSPRLGGEFHVLVDLKEGNILESFKGY